jgi:hypothetical protein
MLSPLADDHGDACQRAGIEILKEISLRDQFLPMLLKE